MQLTASMNEMKMNEVVNGNSSPADVVSAQDADAIVQAFGRQFYVALSANRSDVCKFYGHQSMVKLGEKVAVGQQDIAKFYEENFEPKLRCKIHSMKGVPTLHGGILVHVFGHINFKKFIQIFILGQQCPKKYYIESDVLVFIDELFGEDAEQPTQKINGHSKPPQKPVVEEKAPAAKSDSVPQGNSPVTAPKPVKEKIEVEETPKGDNKPEVPKETTPQKENTPPEPVPAAPAPLPQEPPKPRTWATLVGGSSKSSPATQPKKDVENQPQPRDTHPQTQNANRHEFGSLSERKIYLGGITRTIVPDSTATAETEIKTLFYNFGEVDSVSIPRKVLDSPNDTSKTAFAFITMRNVAAAQKVFESATKDENGQYRLKLKIDAFGFDGMATISEQKDRPSNFQSFRGRGGFQSRGGFGSQRGGRGSNARGSMRGGFHNNYNGNHTNN